MDHGLWTSHHSRMKKCLTRQVAKQAMEEQGGICQLGRELSASDFGSTVPFAVKRDLVIVVTVRV